MVPSKVIAKIEREIKLKATREEYVNNLMAMAAAKEERIRQAQRDQEDEQEAIEMAQFEAIARANKSKNNDSVTEEFSKIVESTEQYSETVTTMTTMTTMTSSEVVVEELLLNKIFN